VTWLIVKQLQRLPFSAKLDSDSGNWRYVILSALVDVYIIAAIADAVGIRIVLG
jgi:hypothetical protein